MVNSTIVFAMSFWVFPGLVSSGSNWGGSRIYRNGLLVDHGHAQLPVLDRTTLFMRKSLLILGYVFRSKNIIREYHKL